MSEEQNGTTKRRRSSVQKETDAVAEIVRVLKPFELKDRAKLIDAARLLLGEAISE